MWLYGMVGGSKKRTPTERELQWAQRLRLAWDARKLQGLASQKDFAARYELTQGMVSHYLTGETLLNTEAMLRFSQYLQLSPVEIWPDFPYADLVARPDESLQLLSEADREVVRSLIRSLSRKRA